MWHRPDFSFWASCHVKNIYAHGMTQISPGALTRLTSKHNSKSSDKTRHFGSKIRHPTSEREVAVRRLRTKLGRLTSAWMDERREHNAPYLGVLRSTFNSFVCAEYPPLFIATCVQASCVLVCRSGRMQPAFLWRAFMGIYVRPFADTGPAMI